MNITKIIESARQKLRKDKGLNGDADRIPLITWVMFLKLLDDYVLQYECERSSIYLASFYPEYTDYIISLPFEYKKGIILCQDNIEYFNKKFKPWS